MCWVILISFSVVHSMAMTTTTTHIHRTHHHHHTHATREPVELETFRYDPHAHMMLTMYHKKCYLYLMSTQEVTAVHASTGLHDLESKLVSPVDATTATYSTMTIDEVKLVSNMFAKTCNHTGWITYKLN